MGIFSGSNDPEKLAKKQAAKEELKSMVADLGSKAKAGIARQLDDAKNPGSAFCEGVSANKLYAAILKSGADLKYSIVHSEANSRLVVFQTHDAEKYWDGNLSCSVYEVNGGSEFKIIGRAEQGFTKSGKGSIGLFAMTTGLPMSAAQAASEGGVLKHQSKLKKTILKNIDLVPESETQENQSKSSDSLANEISKLKDLLNAGILSEEEFSKAKSKLLS